MCVSGQSSCMKLYDWLKVAPYQVDEQSAGDDDDDLSASKGLRVLAVAYSTERSAFFAIAAALT